MEYWSCGVLECLSVFPRVGKTKPGFSNPWNSHTPILHHSTTPARTAGLTLIEVMLAIVILGIGAGTLLVATSRCMAVATKARHYSTAHRLLQRVHVEKPLTRGEVDDGIETGTFEDGYSWEREVLENENEDREGLYTIRTRVRWSARGRNAFEETTTYLYIPPEEDLVAPNRKGSSSGSIRPGRRTTPSAGGGSGGPTP